MSHCLLITNSEIVRDVYALNLKAYLDMDSTIKTSIDRALALLEQEPHLDVIISTAEVEDASAAEAMYNFLVAIDSNLPLVVLGHCSGLAGKDNVYIVNERMNFKETIRIVAKIMGITAQDMFKKVVPEFFSIPASALGHLQIAHCDIYYLGHDLEKKEYVKIVEKNQKIQKKIAKYIEEGTKYLYVHSDDRLNITNSISDIISHALENPTISEEERIIALNDGHEFVAQHIEDVDNIESLLDVSRKCINAMNIIVDDNPLLKNLLSKLMTNSTSYPYQHSQLTAFISSYLVSCQDWGTKEQMEKLTFVCFFHDILLTKKEMVIIDSLKELDQSSLTKKEKDYVLNHAYITSTLIQKMPRSPMGADSIIKHHHGMLNGIGFEEKKWNNNLAPLAIIFIVAEAFTNAILQSEKVDTNGKIYFDFDKNKTISQMKDKFNGGTYRRMINHLEKINI